MHTIYPEICQDKASIDEVTEHLMVTSTRARSEQTTDAGGGDWKSKMVPATWWRLWQAPTGDRRGRLMLPDSKNFEFDLPVCLFAVVARLAGDI